MARTIRLVIALLVPALWMLGCPFQPYYPDGPSGTGGTTTSSSTSSGTGGVGGVDGGMPCMEATQCNDNEPCTTDTCSNGQCVHEPDNNAEPTKEGACFLDKCANGLSVHLQLPVGTPCGPMGSPTTCDSNANCVGCMTKSDCPADNECRTYDCNANKECDYIDIAMGPAPVDPTPGDCQRVQCDGNGGSTLEYDANDKPLNDGNLCTNEDCDPTTGPYKSVGTACNTNGGIVCDGLGTCVECIINSNCGNGGTCSALHTCGKCNDSAQNGNETGVDCGGGCPKRCNGEVCTTNGDCKTNHCTDGVCCDTACGQACKACDVPGKLGTCSNISEGTRDNSLNPCNGTNVCNGNGSCAALNNNKANGESCSSDNDCFNNTCSAGFCRLPNNEPCSDDVQCASLRCTSNVCVPCAANADCATNQCMAGRCKAPNGTPCGAGADCASGACDQNGTHLCGANIGAMCSDPSDCINYNCVMGTCKACNNMSDMSCPAMICNIGTCALPFNAYCIDATDCASNNCSSGFPKKCY